MDTPPAERLDHYLVRLGLAPSRRAARAIVERG
ncbi:MAG: S4 domain-containing protein, partial [Candidatus Binataceae bacterium]